MTQVTFKGNPVNLTGDEVKVGQTAPDFKVQKIDMSDYTLKSSPGKTRILVSVPSLDTPVCDMETRRFNEEAAKLPNVEILTVSTDLPFAQKRWCGAAGVDKVRTASDHRDTAFGLAYGTLIKELRIESRAVFVVDQNGVLQHVEYVKEVAEHPNYDAALSKAKSL